uniref:Uncharacterized protein n=1 Tax=Chlorobium phaeobacteroides (strain BS1) TaxID=331678 RepID=B3EQW0_CHLPB
MKQVGHYEMIGINSRQLLTEKWGKIEGKRFGMNVDIL